MNHKGRRYDRLAGFAFAGVSVTTALVYLLLALDLRAVWSSPRHPVLLFASACRAMLHSVGVFYPLAIAVTVAAATLAGRAALRAWLRWRSTRRAVAALLASRCAPPQNLAALPYPVDWVESDRPIAFTYGFWRPRVLLTTGLARLLDREELEAVLWHEMYHVHRLDPFRGWVVDWSSHALGFIPAVRTCGRVYTAARELAADSAAQAHLGSIHPLAAALFKLAQVAPTPPASASFSDSLRLRIARLLTGEVDLGRPSVRSLALSATVLIGLGWLVLPDLLHLLPLAC